MPCDQVNLVNDAPGIGSFICDTENFNMSLKFNFIWSHCVFVKFWTILIWNYIVWFNITMWSVLWADLHTKTLHTIKHSRGKFVWVFSDLWQLQSSFQLFMTGQARLIFWVLINYMCGWPIILILLRLFCYQML